MFPRPRLDLITEFRHQRRSVLPVSFSRERYSVTFVPFPLPVNSCNARSNYSRGARLFVSDLASRQDEIDEYARERSAHRHRVTRREGVGIRDVGAYTRIHRR